MESDRYLSTARMRGASFIIERKKRINARFKRYTERRRTMDGSQQYKDNDLRIKLRSVLSAIRAHTNTDIDLNTNMSSSQLFSETVKALAEHPRVQSFEESKFIGDALELVAKLNTVISSR
jgi:hypothetical protein